MNSRRHTITSLSIVLLAVTIMSVSAIGQNAYAAGAGMTLSAECSGSSCDVSGTTDRNDQDATMVVTASNGNIVTVGQLSTSDGSFSTSINVSNLDGAYTIAVNQGPSSKYTLSVDIDVSGGSSDSSASISNIVVAATEEAEAAAASTGGLSLTAGGVEGSTTIDVSGTTDRNAEITITVIAPNGNKVSVDVSDGTSDSSASVTNRVAEAAAEESAVEETAAVSVGGGLSLTAGGVEGSTTIDVSGTTDRNDEITITVIAPN